MSTTLTYDFASCSLEDWMKVVQRDLKDKPYAALTWVVDGDIVLEPVNQQDGLQAQGQVLSQQQHQWHTGLFVHQGSANAMIISALENGVNAFVLEAFDEKALYPTVFEGVEPTFIDWIVTVQNTAQVALLKDWFHEQEVAVTFKVAREDHTEVLLFALQQFPSAKFIIGVPFTEGNYSDNLVAQIVAVDRFLRIASTKAIASTTDLLSRVCLDTVLGKEFLVEIAYLRTIHLIWKNYVNAFNAPANDATLVVSFDQKCLSADRDTNLIQLTTMIMSAVLGGASVLLASAVAKDHSEQDAEAIRLSINIQMMLKMESYFDKVADPYAGSYFVEKLTQRLATKVWNQLKTQLHA